MPNAVDTARQALQSVLSVGRGSSGRLILEVQDEQAVHQALAVLPDQMTPYAWEVRQGTRVFFVSAQDFARSSYDSGTFKPLYD